MPHKFRIFLLVTEVLSIPPLVPVKVHFWGLLLLSKKAHKSICCQWGREKCESASQPIVKAIHSWLCTYMVHRIQAKLSIKEKVLNFHHVSSAIFQLWNLFLFVYCSAPTAYSSLTLMFIFACNCTVNEPRINTCSESPSCGLVLTGRGENVFF